MLNAITITTVVGIAAYYLRAAERALVNRFAPEKPPQWTPGDFQSGNGQRDLHHEATSEDRVW